MYTLASIIHAFTCCNKCMYMYICRCITCGSLTGKEYKKWIQHTHTCTHKHTVPIPMHTHTCATHTTRLAAGRLNTYIHVHITLYMLWQYYGRVWLSTLDTTDRQTDRQGGRKGREGGKTKAKFFVIRNNKVHIVLKPCHKIEKD